MYKIRFFDRGFSPDPHRPFGDFENPLGQLAVPSGLRSGRSTIPKILNFEFGPNIDKQQVYIENSVF